MMTTGRIVISIWTRGMNSAKAVRNCATAGTANAAEADLRRGNLGEICRASADQLRQKKRAQDAGRHCGEHDDPDWITGLSPTGVSVSASSGEVRSDRKVCCAAEPGDRLPAKTVIRFHTNGFDRTRYRPRWGLMVVALYCRRRSKSRPLRRLVFQQSSQRGVILGG